MAKISLTLRVTNATPAGYSSTRQPRTRVNELYCMYHYWNAQECNYLRRQSSWLRYIIASAILKDGVKIVASQDALWQNANQIVGRVWKDILQWKIPPSPPHQSMFYNKLWNHERKLQPFPWPPTPFHLFKRHSVLISNSNTTMDSRDRRTSKQSRRRFLRQAVSVTSHIHNIMGKSLTVRSRNTCDWGEWPLSRLHYIAAHQPT